MVKWSPCHFQPTISFHHRKWRGEEPQTVRTSTARRIQQSRFWL